MSLVLNVEILGEFKNLTKATQGSQTELQNLNQKISGFSKTAKAAFASIGVGLSFAVITRELTEATKAAIEDTKGQELLAKQLENTTGATKSQIASVEKQISKLQLTAAVADDKLRPAFAQLTRATGDTTESMKLLELATNISAGSGKSLETITTALTKAYNGQFGALSKLGIPMSDAIGNAADYAAEMKKLTKAQMDQQFALDQYGIKSKEYAKATEKVGEVQDTVNRIFEAGIDWTGQLAETFKGAADAAANTDPYQRMNIIFGEIQETVGMAMLPVLQKLSTWLATPEGEEKLGQLTDLVVGLTENLASMVNWVLDNSKAIIAWSGTIAAALTAVKLTTAGITAYRTVVGLATAANGLFAASNTSVATTATAASAASAGLVSTLRVLSTLAGVVGTVGAVLSLSGSTAQSGTSAGTAKPPTISVPNSPLKPGTTAPKTTTSAPQQTINNIINVKQVADAKAVTSSIADYQMKTGVSLGYLLK